MLFIIILLILAIWGRKACSTICPLGILQALIYKIPFFKKFQAIKGEKYLRKLKYIIFISLIILIPTVFIPNKDNWHDALFFLKIIVFSTIFIASLFIYRPFCKYLCPIGVFLGFFNKVTPFKYKIESTCVKCNLCSKECPMGLTPYKEPNNMECIRCGKCINTCPKKAIQKKRI